MDKEISKLLNFADEALVTIKDRSYMLTRDVKNQVAAIESLITVAHKLVKMIDTLETVVFDGDKPKAPAVVVKRGGKGMPKGGWPKKDLTTEK